MPIEQQSQNVAAGQVGMPPAPKDQQFQYTVDIQSPTERTQQFGDIIVKDQTAQGGRLIRVRDVGTHRPGLADLCAGLQAEREAGCRHRHLPDTRSQFAAGRQGGCREDGAAVAPLPAGTALLVPYDTTIFVQDSITEVYKTLYQAGILVLIVILVFLQNFRATLVPATTVPVTIIGAFAGMAALGFTVNLSTCSASCWRSASWWTMRSSSWKA